MSIISNTLLCSTFESFWILWNTAKLWNNEHYLINVQILLNTMWIISNTVLCNTFESSLNTLEYSKTVKQRKFFDKCEYFWIRCDNCFEYYFMQYIWTILNTLEYGKTEKKNETFCDRCEYFWILCVLFRILFYAVLLNHFEYSGIQQNCETTKFFFYKCEYFWILCELFRILFCPVLFTTSRIRSGGLAVMRNVVKQRTFFDKSCWNTFDDFTFDYLYQIFKSLSQYFWMTLQYSAECSK